MCVSLPSGASARGATGQSDEALVSLTGPASVEEGQTAEFEVTLDQSSLGETQVRYRVRGVAMAGVDYTAPPGHVSIGAGDDSATIEIPILTDNRLDPDHTIELAIVDVANLFQFVTLDATPVTTDIVDTTVASIEARPAFQEIDEGGGGTRVDARLSARPTGNVQVAVAGGAPGYKIYFDQSNWSDWKSSIFFGPHDGNAVDETYTIGFSGSGGGYDGVRASTRIRVLDDDVGRVAVSPNALTIREEDVEGAEYEIRARTQITRANVATVTISSLSPSVLINGSAGSATVRFNSGNWRVPRTVTVTAGGDSDRFDETATLTHTVAGAGYEGPIDDVALLIQDDDGPTVSVRDATAEEGTALGFEVELSYAIDTDVSIPWTASAGTAIAGQDYHRESGSILISAGTTTATVAVKAVDDGLAEDAETLEIAVEPPYGLNAGALTAVGTIQDNDRITASVSSDTEEVSEGATATFTVVLAGGTSTAAVDVGFTVGGNSTSGVDYTVPKPAVVTIPAGGTRAQIDIPTIKDNRLEVGETLDVRLLSATTAVGEASASPRPASMFIRDAVPGVSVSSDGAVAEGEPATFTVRLSQTYAGNVGLNWSTVPGTAAGGDDYTEVSDGTVSVLFGAPTATFSVATVEDMLAEGDETFRVSVSAARGQPDVGSASAEGRIEDIDELSASVNADQASVPEGSAATFTVALSGATSTGDVVVGYAVGGTATPGTDYAVPAGEIRIPAGESSATLSIGILDDTAPDRDETLEVTLTSAWTERGSVIFDATPAATAIMDTDTVMVSATSDGAVEEGEDATFTVRLLAPSGEPVTVNWSTTDGTAVAGEDLIAVTSGVLTIPANETVGTLTVATVEDDRAEAEETFSVSLTAPREGVVLATTSVEGTIRDDDVLSLVMSADETVAEGSTATVTVEISSPQTSTGDVVVTYTVSGTATSGTDYVTPAATLTIPAGRATAAIEFATTDDGVLEPDETVVVTLTGAVTVGQVDPAGPPTETIIEDVNSAAVSVASDGAAEEGEVATFTVSLAGETTEPVEVSWSASGGTATWGLDYGPSATGTVTLAPGQSEATVTVATIEDTLLEGDETFTLTLTLVDPLDGLMLSADEAIGRIVDDEQLEVSVNADAAMVVEGDEAEFTVSVAGGTLGADVVVSYEVSGTATAGADYPAPSGMVTIKAGETEGSIGMVTIADGFGEGNETVVVELTDASTLLGTVSVNMTPAETTITDADTLSTEVTLTASPVTVDEDAVATTVTVTAELDAAPRAVDTVVTVSVGAGGDSAVAGTDYGSVSDFTVRIPAGSTSGSGSFELTPVDDAVSEGDEELSIEGSVSGLDVIDTAVTIADDEGPVMVTLESDGPVKEGEVAMFTVTLSAELPDTLRMTASGRAGTARSPQDYATLSEVLAFAPGVTEQTVSVQTAEDTLVEGEERFTVLIEPLPGFSIPAGEISKEGVIEDDDALEASVVADAARVAEGGTALFTVELTGGTSTSAVVVTYTVGGTAVSGLDYVAALGSLTIGAGDDVGEIEIETIDDAFAEADEKVVITLTGASTAGAATAGAGTAETTIEDDETLSTAVTLTASPVTVDEDAGATTVTVTAELNEDAFPDATEVTVSVGASGDSAVEGTDYGSVADFTVRIPAGSTSVTETFTLTPVDDAVDEEDETVTVGGSVTGLTVIGTELAIGDDDTRGVEVSPTSLTVPEGESKSYTVVLRSSPTGPVTVTLDVTGSGDVTVLPSSLDFSSSNWETAQTVTVSASEDGDGAVDEATVEHTVSGGDYGSETASDVAVTVAENDTASTTVTLTASPVTVDEDAVAETVTVTAELDAAPRAVDTVVTVSVGAGGDSAVEGTDYGSVADFTVRIPAGSTSVTETFTLTPVDDAVDEEDETVTVGGSVTGLTVIGTELAIGDDDTRGVEVSPTSLTVPEGESKSYTVVLRSSPTGPVTVTLDVTGSGDVTVLPSSLDFSSSNWETAQTVTVSASDDGDGAVDEATVEHTVSGGDYGSETASDVAVTVAENDTASTTVTLTAEPVTVDEDAVADDGDGDGGAGCGAARGGHGGDGFGGRRR